MTSISKWIWHPWSNILRPHAGREVIGGVLGPRAVDAEFEEAVEVARWKAVHLVCGEKVSFLELIINIAWYNRFLFA